jgi:regulatory protein
MKITKIEAQVKTRGRYSIFVDDVFAFGLSEMALINSGIKVGLEITAKDLENFKQESDLDKIYGRLLDLLARRPRSEWELRDYLKRKKVEKDHADKLLNKLSKSGYVNDEDFARRWVDSRRLLKSTSKRKLQLELRQKRISDEIINKVLADDETDELEVLKNLIVKKRIQTRYQDDQKLMAYLVRQGFTYSDIKQALSA